jgi:hypothetical protein
VKKLLVTLCVIFTVLCISVPAYASIVQYSDRASFEAQGTIYYNYGFEDFGSGIGNPTEPWTSNGVTYKTYDYLIISPSYASAPISNVLIPNYSSDPILADIETSPNQYDMFGLDLGYSFSSVYSSETIYLEIYTNLGSYSYTNSSPPNVNSSQDFYGFITWSGEYFTGFEVGTNMGTFTAIDNVTLGIVPIPGALWLFGTGLIGIVGIRRKVKK